MAYHRIPVCPFVPGRVPVRPRKDSPMSPTIPTPTDLTRQQLDELDALLQRMLSLPLNAPPANPTPVPAAPSVRLPAGWRSDPVPTPRPPHVAEAEVEAFEPAMAVSLAAPAQPFAPPAMPSAGPLRGVDAPALPSNFAPPTDPTPAPPPVEVAYAEPEPVPLAAAEPTRAWVPVPLWPLFAVNWILELFLGLLGPVGAALTHPAMKHLLGFAGLLLLAGAAAWSARGMGWVSW